jgi:hypothetical protein
MPVGLHQTPKRDHSRDPHGPASLVAHAVRAQNTRTHRSGHRRRRAAQNGTSVCARAGDQAARRSVRAERWRGERSAGNLCGRCDPECSRSLWARSLYTPLVPTSIERGRTGGGVPAVRKSSAVSRWLTGWPAAGALALLSFVAAVLGSRGGPGITPDSVDYIVGARHLAQGVGYSDFSGRAATNFPPLFPSLLALGERLGVSATDTARFVNAAALALTALLAFALLCRVATSRAIAIAATAAVACSPVLLRISSIVWSESVFVVFVMGSLLCLTIVAVTPPGRARDVALLGAAASAAAGFMVRYAGLALIGLGLMTLILLLWRESWRALAIRVTAYTVIAGGVPLLWYLRNRSASPGEPLGPRVATHEGPARLARLLGEALVQLPDLRPTAFGAVVVVGLIIVACFAAFLPRRTSAQVSWLRPLVPLVVFLPGYVVFAVVSRLTAGSDLSWRILAPAWVPLVVLGAVGVERMLVTAKRADRDTLVRVLTVVVTGAVVACGGVFLKRVARPPDRLDWVGAFSASPLSHAARREAPSTVLSNNPWKLAFDEPTLHTDLAFTPMRPGLSHRALTTGAVVSHACAGPVWLAWFHAAGEPSRPALRGTGLSLRTEASLADGTLYSVVPSAVICHKVGA